ncbi:MAG: hypothetical protein ISR77_30720 [Pirellulaceae bacterium]|nr:hypothetical protein [Pirellulaceae bacterium]
MTDLPMKVSGKSVAVVSLLAMFFATAQFGASPQTAWPHESESGEQGANGKGGRPINFYAIEGLELSILSVSADSNDPIRLKVVFENVSDRDIVLNLGMMLANGKVQLPEEIRLTLTDESGRSRQLHFSDRRYPGVSGRVDDYIVPLRAGSAYTLNLSLRDYWCPKSKEFTLELKPERYTVRAEFTGKSARHLNSDTEGLEFMPFWTGKLKSAAVHFQIGKQG